MPQRTCHGTVSDRTLPMMSAQEYVVAMAYVPWQNFTTVYEPDRALTVGTIFPELDKPFLAARGGECR